MNWLFEHQQDVDINEPIVPVASSKQQDDIPKELIIQVCELGFTEGQAKKALKETDKNVERAVDWLFNHPNETGEEEPSKASVPSSAKQHPIIDKSDAKYKCSGFILHKGNSVQMGHYVAYLNKDGKWICFDDTRVQESKEPPVHAGFIYLWEKI